VPNRRGTADQSLAWRMWRLTGGSMRTPYDGAGDGAGVETVTWIGLGLALINVRPVVRFAVAVTSWVPGSSPPTSSVRTRFVPDSRSSSAIEPPIVTSTRSVERAYS